MKKKSLFISLTLLTIHSLPAFAAKDFLVSNVTEFRQALAYSGERTVHFNVPSAAINNPFGFVLYAKDHEDFTIENGDITIDGSTAAAPVTLYGARLKIKAQNVKINNIRVRLGATGFTRHGKDDKDAKNVVRESLLIDNSSHIDIRNCSFSWGTDETVNIISSSDVKLVNSIISEPLNEPKDEYGDYIHYEQQAHGYCLLIVGSEKVLVQNVVFANCLRRSPSVSPDGSFEKGSVLVANNIVYNYGEHGSKYNDGSNDGTTTSFTLNTNSYIPGINTSGNAIEADIPRKGSQVKMAAVDNYVLSKPATVVFTKKKNKGKISVSDRYRLIYEEGMLIPARDLEKALLGKVGATAPYLDMVDSRVISQLKSRTGKIINHEKDLPEYPYLIDATKNLE